MNGVIVSRLEHRGCDLYARCACRDRRGHCQNRRKVGFWSRVPFRQPQALESDFLSDLGLAQQLVACCCDFEARRDPLVVATEMSVGHIGNTHIQFRQLATMLLSIECVGVGSAGRGLLCTFSMHARLLDQTPGDDIVDGGDSKNIVLAIENFE
jgi:hypothetical protein